ncbi:amyloid fiber anchoring/assembly protein TapA [Bacillaceae bacterium C204]|uniref:amyloid fiber anchoring/assembly protein TapA n=1 Tax=Neobacillus sp. 204 TaxID=3383351 RepID=UPI00397C0B81
MIKIRKSRLKKYGKKNRKVLIVAQLLGIGYIFTFGIGFLTTNTGAYFNDETKTTVTFQAGTWETEWDKSSLKFTRNDQTFESCNQKEITVTLTNTGSDMEGPSRYEVYYIDKGNPKDGEKVADGVIEPILANKSSSLKYTASKPGNYKFRAFQRPNHAFKDESQDLWSDTITITCKTKSSNETQQNQINNNQGEQTETQPTENINENDNKSLKPEDSETNQTEKIDSPQNEEKPEVDDTNQTDDSVPSQNDPEPEDADTNQSGNIDSSQDDLNSTEINPEIGNTSP